jgi:RNA polymerase sigma-70 factor, ECF subfamily
VARAWVSSPPVPTTPEDVGRAIAEARGGDGDALAVLWRTHQPQLLRYLRGRGAADAADLTTQVWIDVARNLDGFRGEDVDDFRRWLFTIARRRLIDDRRRASRRRAVEPLAAGRAEATAPANSADVDYDERDSLTRALALVARLPDQMRDAVLLRHVGDLSVADAAEVMGLRAGHVRVLTHRGLLLLERMLTEEAEDAVTRPPAPAIERRT